MADVASLSLAKLTLPISMLTTIIGGSAWLTTTRSDVNHLERKVTSHVSEFKTFKEKIYDKQNKQGELISKMDGKLDLMLKQLQIIERRLNAASRRSTSR